MTMKPMTLLTILLLCLAPCQGGTAGAKGVPRSLVLDGIKMQWASGGEEQLPTWISARFSFDAQGKPSGRVTEIELGADGADEDGDPAGFSSEVFDSGEGKLQDLRIDAGGFSFTLIYPGRPETKAAFVGRFKDGWTVAGMIKGGGRPASAGQNRFPLAQEEKDGGVEIYTDPGEDAAGSQSL